MRLSWIGFCLLLSGCGVVYNAPQVGGGFLGPGAEVKVIPITKETVGLANRAPYRPAALPAAFSQAAGGAGAGPGAGALPPPVFEPETRPGALPTRIPPEVSPGPYRIGVSDVLLLATPQAGSTVEELSKLLAAQNRRQGYTVQDNGTITLPGVGRIDVAGQTIEQAEDQIFRALVEAGIEPSFSLEIADFNARRVSVGGAVATPTVVPIRLNPLYLDEALIAAGGVRAEDLDYATVQLYRDGELYQIPLRELYSSRNLQRIQLIDEDSIFVDTAYDLVQAQAFFEQQIRLNQVGQASRTQALQELQTAISISRGRLEEARDNFLARLELGAVDRGYVYLTGEVADQGRFPLPFEETASLADALFGEGGYPLETGNSAAIYVLRETYALGDVEAVTAWHLNARNAANLVLATRFEMRPNDVVFVAEQPVTKWNRVISQLTPSVVSPAVATVRQ